MVFDRYQYRRVPRPSVPRKEILAGGCGKASSLPRSLKGSQFVVLLGQFLQELEELCRVEPRLRQRLAAIYSRFEALL